MHIDSFISYLKHEKRYSPHTIESYLNDLNGFAAYLKETYSLDKPSEISHFQIRSWMAYLMEDVKATGDEKKKKAKITPRSINRKISTLKSYFKFLMKQGLAEKNPTLKVITPKTSKRLPVYVEKTGTDNLLNHTEFEAGFAGVRNKLMLEMLYSTGIRLSELINLKESDIDAGRNEMKVLGKGNKQRVIPLDKKLLNSISDYLSAKPEVADSAFLFVTDDGKKLYPKFVYRIVNRYLGMVTTVDKKSPHTMRHTFATHLVDNGADLNAVKELLGHSSLAATQVYTHNSIGKLKEAYKKAHPKA